MATHSSILAWRISWTGEPGGLQSIVLQKGGPGKCVVDPRFFGFVLFVSELFAV